MRDIREMLNQEIIMRVSTLVHDLTSYDSEFRDLSCTDEETMEFWIGPIKDCDIIEALEYEGYKVVKGGDNSSCAWTWVASKDDEVTDEYDDLQEIAYDLNVEVERRDVFEHWAVTGWLGHALEELGEKVIYDWHGIPAIWCRTTTGQSIEMDDVIEELYKRTHKPCTELK